MLISCKPSSPVLHKSNGERGRNKYQGITAIASPLTIIQVAPKPRLEPWYRSESRPKYLSSRVSLMSRLHPCHHGCACFVPEPGQNIHRPLSKKNKRASKWVGLSCQCLVLVRSDFDSISGSAVRVSAPHQNLFSGWVNTTLGELVH